MREEAAITHVRRDEILIAAIIGLFLCVTVPLGVTLNIWIDEAYSLLTTSRDLAFALKHSREFETQPPVYFVGLWLWRHLSDSIAFARLSSVAAGAAALWAMHLAARRWVPNVASAWVVGPLAINAYFLYAATEIRAYAFVILLAALLLVLFHDGFYVERPRRAMQTLFALTALAAISTFYYMGFLLVAPAAVLLAERRWRVLSAYIGWVVLVGAVFMPGFLLGVRHTGVVSHALVEMPSPLRSLELVVSRLFSMPFAFTYLPTALKWSGMFAAMVAVLTSLWVFRSRITPRVRALWIIAAVVALFYLAVVQFVMGEFVLNRHFLVLLIPSTLAVFSVTTLYGRHTRTALAVWLTVALGFNAVESFGQFRLLAKAGDYKRVARYLEEHEAPGQSIAIVALHAELPLRYYYHGTSRLVPLPEQDDYTNYVFEEWRLESVERVRQQLTEAVSDEGLIWVFSDRPPDAVFFGVDLNFEILEDVLRSDYVLQSDRDFYLAKVRSFKKRESAVTVDGAAPPPDAPSA